MHKTLGFAMICALSPLVVGCSSNDDGDNTGAGYGGWQAPIGGTVVASGGIGGTTVPLGGTVDTGGIGGTSVPTGGTSVPTGGMSVPTGGMSVPTGGMSVPTGGTFVPTGGTFVPTSGIGGAAGMIGGAGGTGDGTCATESTSAIHVVVGISWPATLAATEGSGDLHIWLKSHSIISGTPNPDGSYSINSTAKSCGSYIPDIESLIRPGEMMSIVIPDEIWELAGMPETASTGTMSSNGPNATISMQPSGSAIGVTMTDPLNDPWPATGAEMLGSQIDHDQDGSPGITGNPRSDGPYKLPPVDAIGGALGTGPFADKLYLATRVVMTIDGVRTSCTTASGTATVSYFDNHVLGCHVQGAGECDAIQAEFIDTMRTVYEIHAATFEQVDVPDTANCADVRAALPML